MKLLAIETSTQICAAAVTDGDRLLAEYRTNLKNVHAEMIFCQIDRLFHDIGLQHSDLDGIAVSIGPGSFTGLRIGLAAAKGLAFAHQLPLVGVPSLSAVIAGVAIESGRFVVVRKSRVDEYYCAVYERRNWHDQPVNEIQVFATQALLEALPTPCYLAGDVGELRERADGCTLLPEHLMHASAFQVARIGVHLFERRQFIDLESSEPLYHQEFVAAKPTAVV